MNFYSSRPSGNSYLPKHKMGAKGHANQPAWSTRRRNTYIKYLVIIGLVVLLYFNWNRAADEFDNYSPYTISFNQKGKSSAQVSAPVHAPPRKDGDKEKIAIVTFTTGEKSYTYLSLKNKAGKSQSVFPLVCLSALTNTVPAPFPK